MKKDVLKKSLKLQLHRETLRTLEEPQLLGAVGGSDTDTVTQNTCRNGLNGWG
jgi:hypothetical protein